MAIRFECPHCGRSIKVPDEFAGKRGKCPHCKQVVIAPAPKEPEPLAPREVGGAAPRVPPSGASKPETKESRPPRRADQPAPSRTPEQQPWLAPSGPTTSAPPTDASYAVKVGEGASAIPGMLGGCFGPSLFAGEFYSGQHYYLAGAARHQRQVLDGIADAVKSRGPEDLKVTPTRGQAPGIGQVPRDILAIRWSIGYGYVVCFAPGKDLFVSVRVHFVPGCLARAMAMLPGYTLAPNLFGVDDLNMLLHCIITTVEEQLDALQLSYVRQVIGTGG